MHNACCLKILCIVPLFVFVFVAFDLPTAVAISTPPENALFAPPSPEDSEWIQRAKTAAAKDKLVVQIDFARLRTDVLFQRAIRPGLAHQPIRPITLSLSPNMPELTVITTSVKQSARGYIEWEGYIQGKRESLVALIVTEGSDAAHQDAGLAGTIIVSKRTFRIRPDQRGTHAIIEIDTSKFPAEGLPRSRKRPSIPTPSVGIERSSPLIPPSVSSGPHPLSPDPGYLLPECQIDILVAYTTAAKNAMCMSCLDTIDKDIEHAVQLANMSYTASGVNQQLNLLNKPDASYETCVLGFDLKQHCYNESGDLNTDLDNINKAQDPGIGLTDPAYPLKVVSQWRNSLSADLVALWEQGPTDAGGNHTICGVSNTMFEDPPGTVHPDPLNAYSVVPRVCGVGQYSMAHEFAHLGAANHDRGSSGLVGLPADLPPYFYSFGYVLPPPTSGQQPMSIMAVPTSSCPENANAHGIYCCSPGNCTRGMGFWSNPGSTYGGIETGATDAYNPTDNHLILNTSAEFIANYRLPEVMPGVCKGTINVSPSPPSNLRVR